MIRLGSLTALRYPADRSSVLCCGPRGRFAWAFSRGRQSFLIAAATAVAVELLKESGPNKGVTETPPRGNSTQPGTY